MIERDHRNGSRPAPDRALAGHELAIVRQQLERAQSELRQAQRRLAETQRLARVGSWERDVRTGETVWSEEMFRIQGIDPTVDRPSKNLADTLTHEDDREIRQAWLEEILANPGTEIEQTMRLVHPNGTVRTVRARGTLVIEPDGSANRMIGTVQDISEEVRRKQAEAVLAQIVQSSTEAIITIGGDLLIRSWNPAAERMFGYTAEEMIGKSIDLLQPEGLSAEERETRRARQRRLLGGYEQQVEYEARRRRKDGTVLDVHAITTPLRNHEGEIVGLVTNLRDITERRRAEERVAHLASHDTLTGLINRHRFDEELAVASAMAEREGVEAVLLTLDLDNFKYINQTYGHNTGDELVAGLATAIGEVLDPDDVVARLSGDCFGVLRVPCDAAAAQRLAEDMQLAVDAYWLEVDGERVQVTASLGGVTFGGEFASRQTSPAELMADADRAMSDSKEAGRNRVTIYGGAERIDVRRRSRSAGEHLIRDALQHDRFELFAQPIVNLATGAASHVEMLLRLRRDEQLIGPGEFLPTAERLGLIHLVDYWVISHALEVAAQHPDLVFDINLSGATIDDQRLESFIAQELRNSGVSPRRIVFELTETAAVGNISRARELAGRLSELGCRFAIDDFGAGFSTFYYLKHFPADYVKIDGEFMSDPRSRMDEIVIRSIVRLAVDLGKQTIAEYVADEQTFERVRALGVDFGQGYHFAEPFPVSRLGTMPRRVESVHSQLPVGFRGLRAVES